MNDLALTALMVITVAAGIMAFYFFFVRPKKARNIPFYGMGVVLAMMVLVILSFIINYYITEAALGEALDGGAAEIISSNETPYYAVITPTCLYSLPDSSSDCRVSVPQDAVIYIYATEGQNWLRARTLVVPDESEIPEEIGWIETKKAIPTQYPTNFYFQFVLRQVISTQDIFLSFLEVCLGVIALQLFKRKKKIAGVVVGLPFVLLSIWTALGLSAKIFSYRIRDAEFINWLQMYPILILMGVIGSNYVVDGLIDWITAERPIIFTPKKKRVLVLGLRYGLLLLIFILFLWAGTSVFRFPFLFVPYRDENLNLSVIDFERNPLGATMFTATLALISGLTWIEGGRLQERGELTLKRAGFYVIFSFVFLIPIYLIPSLFGINEPVGTALVHCFWLGSVLIFFWSGWDILFAYFLPNEHLRVPIPLFKQKRVCFKCEQPVEYRRERILGHAPGCPWMPNPHAEQIFRTGLELLGQKKWEQAASLLRAGSESHPDSIRLAIYYAKTLMELGDLDQALTILATKIPQDPLPEYSAIQTDALIAKGRLDDEFRTGLLIEAKKNKAQNPSNWYADKIIDAFEPELKSSRRQKPSFRIWFLGEKTEVGDKSSAKMAYLLINDEVVFQTVTQVPLAGFTPDSFILTNMRYILYRPGLFGRINFQDNSWSNFQDAHMSEGIFWAKVWFVSKDRKKLLLDRLPKEQARALYRFAQEKEDAEIFNHPKKMSAAEKKKRDKS